MSGSLQRGVALARPPRARRGPGLDDPPAGRAVPGHGLLHRDGRPVPGLRRPRPRRARRRGHESSRSGDKVRVEMRLDDDYDVPADAKAVVLAPSLVVATGTCSSHPVYNGGPKMKRRRRRAAGPHRHPGRARPGLRRARRAVGALGPNGANKNGALSDLVDVGAANLEGNGEALNRTLNGFSQAVPTLAEYRDDLFGSLDNLQTFTTALAASTRRSASSTTTWPRSASSSPASARTSRPAVGCSATALGDVAGFIRDNTTLLTRQREPTRRRHPGAGAAAGPRARCSTSRRPRWATCARLQPRLRHARHPRQRGGRARRRGRRLRRARQLGRVDLRPTCRARPTAPLRTTATEHLRPAAVRRTRTPTAGRRPQRQRASRTTRSCAGLWRGAAPAAAADSARRASPGAAMTRRCCGSLHSRRGSADAQRLRFRGATPSPSPAATTRQGLVRGDGRVHRRPRPGAAVRPSRSTT